MSQRRQIVLADPVDLQLRELAAAADTPPSTLAAQLVTSGVAQAANDGKVRPLRPAHLLVGSKGSDRAPWLQPYGGDPDWSRQMWGQVVALHGRYPRQLEKLKGEWWKDESQTETLCALAVWRAEIDDSGEDPAKSSPSKTSSATTPNTYASKAAASPRCGSRERRQQIGHRSNRPTSRRLRVLS
jgi:hypothetical protein